MSGRTYHINGEKVSEKHFFEHARQVERIAEQEAQIAETVAAQEPEISEHRAAFEKRHVTWNYSKNADGSYRDWDVENAWGIFKDGWLLALATVPVAAQEPLLQSRDRSAYSRFWQLVPKNLSDEMYAIVKEAAPRWNAASVWTNLLDAAPVAPIDGEQDKCQPVAWMVPHLVKFKGVEGASCPSELQLDMEGTVMWSPRLLGDTPPVVDRHGVTHKPYPLKRA